MLLPLRMIGSVTAGCRVLMDTRDRYRRYTCVVGLAGDTVNGELPASATIAWLVRDVLLKAGRSDRVVYICMFGASAPVSPFIAYDQLGLHAR